GKPVYCYDHFGGPGWLSASNFEVAEYFNFSGRDTPVRKSPQEIATELIDGSSKASRFVMEMQHSIRDRYSLNFLLANLIGLNPPPPNGPTSFELANPLEFQRLTVREAVFGQLIRRAYRAERNMLHQVKHHI